jgi:hypothetical protein
LDPALKRLRIAHSQAVPGRVIWANEKAQYDEWTGLVARFQDVMTECYLEITQHSYPPRARHENYWLHAPVKDWSDKVGRDDAWLWKVDQAELLVMYMESPEGPTIVYIRPP